MLDLVDVGPRHVSAYRSVAPEPLLDDLEQAAARLRSPVLHVNATPYGGGVSELLRSIVPLMNDLGTIAHWKIIRGDERFFESAALAIQRRGRRSAACCRFPLSLGRSVVLSSWR
jgi:trehalose synthase